MHPESHGGRKYAIYILLILTSPDLHHRESTRLVQLFFTTTRISQRNPLHVQTPLSGWLEAFAAHPRIGDTDSLRQKFSSFAEFSKGEQSSAVSSASEETLQELSRWNRLYEDKFGHIFIICAAGKSAQHMLDALTSRYGTNIF